MLSCGESADLHRRAAEDVAVNLTNGLVALRSVPWMFCAFLALLPWLAARVLPAVVRLLGHSMSALAGPCSWVLALPAVWAAKAVRRRGSPEPQVLHTYERGVEAIHRGMRYGGPTLATVRGPSRPLRRRWFVLPTVLVLVLWFSEPLLPVSGLRAQALGAKCGVLRVQTSLTGADGWSGPNYICPLPPATSSGEAPAAGSPVGVLDVARYDGRQIITGGWAVDPSAPSEPVEIHVYVDPSSTDAVAVEVLAAAPRPDVAKVRGMGANSGFGAFVLADSGPHSVCVFAMDQGEGADSALGCKDIPASR